MTSAPWGDRPVVIDLFCCEGGVSVGLARAGFFVVGADLFEDFTRKRYPFAAYTGDALGLLRALIAGEKVPFTTREGATFWIGLDDVAFIAASPPCQKHSAGTRAGDRSKYPDLIGPVRDLLIMTGKPYMIENVVGAPLVDPVELCGCMFDLKAVDTDGILLHMWRPRQFESNLDLVQPVHGALRIREGAGPFHSEDFHAYEWVGGSYGGARRDKYEAKYVRKGGYVPSIPVQQALLGIDWMTQKGMHQSIPPVYAAALGRQILELLKVTT